MTLLQDVPEVQHNPADYSLASLCPDGTPPVRSEHFTHPARATRELLVEYLGAEKAAAYRARAEALERWRSRRSYFPASITCGFDATHWASRHDGPDHMPRRPTATTEQVRLRHRGERWARVVRMLAPWITGELLGEMAEPIGKLVNAIIDQRTQELQRGK